MELGAVLKIPELVAAYTLESKYSNLFVTTPLVRVPSFSLDQFIVFSSVTHIPFVSVVSHISAFITFELKIFSPDAVKLFIALYL